jgi:hypothetical protein
MINTLTSWLGQGTVHALTSWLGLGIIAAAVLVTLALEVLDERAVARGPAGAGSVGRPRKGPVGTLLRVVLALLVIAALAATVVRLVAFMG